MKEEKEQKGTGVELHIKCVWIRENTLVVERILSFS